MMFDYEVLRLIWWALLGLLLIGFSVTDGFDLGVAMLLPFVGKSDSERRIIINSIGPVWEGNQVWLILGAGAIFAAWPLLYAVAFSGFYLAMFLALFAIILRPVGFKFRSKILYQQWRQFWDWALFVGGAIPSLVFGIAFGNIFLGAEFYFDETLRIFYKGTFWGLLSPFAFLCGGISLTMMLMHGGLYLALKTEDPLAKRAKKASFYSGVLMLGLFAVASIWLWKDISGYQIVSGVSRSASSNPLAKEVITRVGGWVENYRSHPGLCIIPLSVYFWGGLALLGICRRKIGFAFTASALSIASMIVTAGVGLFPFLLPSSLNLAHSLTVWDASSSQRTLFIMLVATVLLLPFVLAYTTWVFHVLRGKVTADSLEENQTNAY